MELQREVCISCGRVFELPADRPVRIGWVTSEDRDPDRVVVVDGIEVHRCRALN